MEIENPRLIGTSQGFGIPAGGTSGQVLRKIDGTNYNTEWVNNGLPTGGTSGQLLIKNSSTSGDASWKSLSFASVTVSAIPTSSNQDITPVLSRGDGITVSGNNIVIANPGVYMLNASLSIRATYAEYGWVDSSNNQLAGTNLGISNAVNGSDTASPSNAMGIVNIASPNTIIKLRMINTAGFTTQNILYSGATILQLR
jgi:hypothetical protein